MAVRKLSAGRPQTANRYQRWQTVYVQFRSGATVISPGRRAVRAESGLQASSSAPHFATCASGGIHRG
jgi:hypothetical protein